jgi:alkylation response protein AidB-like acyl-CoA dehydrogenase
MKAPGITVQPLLGMPGFVAFNQELFENVRVPQENLVGEENQGWYIGAALLNFERSNIAGAASTRRNLDELMAYCREAWVVRSGAPCRELVRHQLAELVIEVEAGRMLSYRVASLQDQGVVPSHEASAAKLYHSELNQRVAEAGYQLMGLYGQVRPESPRWAKLAGRFCMAATMSMIGTIAGGSSEIQRNIIATRGLGLPRG